MCMRMCSHFNFYFSKNIHITMEKRMQIKYGNANGKDVDLNKKYLFCQLLI